MNYYLTTECGNVIGIWHRNECLGQVLDTNKGKMSVINKIMGCKTIYIICAPLKTSF